SASYVARRSASAARRSSVVSAVIVPSLSQLLAPDPHGVPAAVLFGPDERRNHRKHLVSQQRRTAPNAPAVPRLFMSNVVDVDEMRACWCLHYSSTERTTQALAGATSVEKAAGAAPVAHGTWCARRGP